MSLIPIVHIPSSENSLYISAARKLNEILLAAGSDNEEAEQEFDALRKCERNTYTLANAKPISKLR